MNNKLTFLSLLLLGLGTLTACNEDSGQQPQAALPQTTPAPPKVVDLMQSPPSAPPSEMVSGPVAETVDAGGYTYVRLEVNGESLWAAGPTTAMAVGDTIAFSTMIPMKDFHSKTMNRDFPVLYFVDGFVTQNPASSAAATTSAAATPASASAPGAEAQLEKVAGGYTIAEALAQKAELAGKPIKVRGQVTKFTPGIMGKNWIHIVDGSGADDLIITTSGTTAIGAVIVAEGALSLDRDFGYGYHFDVLMEDAAVTAE